MKRFGQCPLSDNFCCKENDDRNDENNIVMKIFGQPHLYRIMMPFFFENEIVMKGFSVSGNVHCKDFMKIFGQPQL